MNTAARLEAANKALETAVLVSREAKERSGREWWRPMGRVRLRGRATPVDLFEPAPNFAEEDRALLTEALAAFDADDSEARAAALLRIKALADRHPEDAALANLVYRYEYIGDGGTYGLG
jgi:adenylate cyclase